MFSATFYPKVREAVESVTYKPNKIILHKHELTVADIKEFCIDCKNAEGKLAIMEDIYGYLSVGQTIIFVNTRALANNLHDMMQTDGFKVSVLSGDMDFLQRNNTLLEFRKGKTTVLITTNLLSRGIDIEAVSLVINYEIPYDQNGNPDTETYIHRVGRTGRFGRDGVAINFLDDPASKNAIKRIIDFYKKPIDFITRDELEEFINTNVNKKTSKK